MTANPEQLLEAANLGLARLLGREPLPLGAGGARALEDALWVWGVLGGKEVGKSTLINALAGAEVSESTQRVGEGTLRPTAYGAAADMPAVECRLGAVHCKTVRLCPSAPPQRRGLVLVDLPDFDSLFEQHVEQVREVARVLDGIIWVTTPKKLGDLRAIEEIRRVLKARINFVYVVNKVDWLLSQSNGSPQADLQRTREMLARQITASDGQDAGQTYLISALHCASGAILAAIARSRQGASAGESWRPSAELAGAVQTVAEDFVRLRNRLTAAPAAGEAEANKRANLAYQIAAQSRAVIDHFRPHELLQRLRDGLSPDALQQLAARTLPPEYCAALARRLQDPQRRSAEWAGRLFRARVADWPLLGVIAWPLVALGAVADTLRQLRGRPADTGLDDPFFADGVPLDDRLRHLLSTVEQRLGPQAEDLAIELPESERLAWHFRSQAAAIAAAHSEAAIAPYIGRRPTWLGRTLRGLIPLAVLAWFPLVQPLLAAWLSASGAGSTGETGGWLPFDLTTLATLVAALSAHHVLLGLLVSLLIVAGLVGAIYSGAVRDAHAAVRQLTAADPQELAESLLSDVVRAVRGPIETVEHELERIVETLSDLQGRITDGRSTGDGSIQ